MPQLLPDSVISARLRNAPGWRIAGGRTRTIQRRYVFGDFVKAIDFVNVIARFSEEAAHHPNIDIRYNQVTLALSTHSLGGISDLDFALANRFDAAAPSQSVRAG
jgi:4a-hydroxytetrahydrobiopterin dehydratase